MSDYIPHPSLSGTKGIVDVRKADSKEGDMAQNFIGAVEDDLDSDIDEFTDAL
jgi:hypothetical protein